MSKNKKPLLRNRVVERRRMNVAELALNERNWREHPTTQRKALQGILEDVGQVGELYAYHSQRNGGALTLIDGHLRKDLGGQWDVAITDLDDAEADKLLLVYDPIAAMAATNKAQLETLMNSVKVKGKDLAGMLEAMAQKEVARQETPRGQYAILIQCESEEQQVELLERFAEERLVCRALIS